MASDLQSYAILFLIWLISTVLVWTIFSNFRTTARHFPPGPIALPIIGHLHLIAPIPQQAFHKLSKRYGPLIYLRLGSVPAVVASNADTAREILKTHEAAFASRPQSSAVRYLTYGSSDFSFAPYGPYWKFMKKICMSELLGGRTLDQLQPIRHEEIRRFLRLIHKKSNGGEAVNVGQDLITITNNIISRMTISRICSDTEGEAEEVGKLVHDVTVLVGTFNVSDYIGFCRNLDLQGLKKRYKDVHRRFDAMMERIIKEREEGRKMKMERGDGVKDILDILLDISEDESAEMKLTRDNIKAFITDIIVGGADTTAITMEWALAELINHPDIFKKARVEIDSVVGKNKLVEESDVQNLPYLQAIVKETVRLHPAIPVILRESTRDCKIGGYDVLANTQVFINAWAIGRDPNYWVNPLEFRPERFMPSNESNPNHHVDVRGQHFHFLPFGSGQRGCPGTSLALEVVQTMLASMIQCFDWTVVIDGETKTVNMTEGPGLSLTRAHPLMCVPIARANLVPFN
ncbi:cytochrome P450 93A3-like [Magnolia sinica]|uniref:cytochrome P450 93A3-like n=1 Tax=Magnolia sinica TaxID=86752 RepID=UPI0026595A35|nr:cytochrome P450 93A3-like [Magnolia sinica]